MPSRRFYVARKLEYEDIIAQKARKRLSLNRKNRTSVFYAENSDDNEEPAQLIKKVCIRNSRILA